MCIIYKAFKLRHKKYKKIFALSIKMQNLLKSELRLIAKKEVLVVTKVCQKMNAINRSAPAKSYRENIFKSKRKEIKKSLMVPSKKNILKSKMKEIKEILYDPILDRDEKIEEIKKKKNL